MGLSNTEEGNLNLGDTNHSGRGAYTLLICSLLYGALMPGILHVRAGRVASEQTPIEALRVPELEAGFHLLYELKPQEARNQFESWQRSHPEDPLGSASEAASYLFEECYRQGVLSSEFFLNNKRFLGKIPLKPDPQLRAAFFAADKQAQELAQLRLKTDPDDANALFAMALSAGMQADYASLIDKQQLDSLKKIREADIYANKLLVIPPDAADAYLGLGTANYVIGSLPGIKKFFLGFSRNPRRQESRNQATRDCQRARALPPAVCEDFAGDGGPAREKNRSSPQAT
jgi:hypothetical protein